MTSCLLASMCWRRIVMRRLRTHFEQVPLAVAKKILADELKQKSAAERAQGSRNEELEEAPLAETTVDD